MWKKTTRYYRRLRYVRLKAAGYILFAAALLLPSYVKWQEPEENLFTVYLNGVAVGKVEDVGTAEELFVSARRDLVADSEELIFIDVDMNVVGQAVLFGKTDEEEIVKENMSRVLSENIKETTKRSYAVKVNNYMVNLGSIEEVRELLQTAVDKYDESDRYQVAILHATGREFNVLTAKVLDTQKEEVTQTADAGPHYKGGFEQNMDEIMAGAEPAGEKSFSDYELGIQSMNFSEEIEIAEVYLDESQISDVQTAVEEVIKEQEVNAVYTVVAGDTLSEIAIKTNIPMDEIVAMNDALESTSTMIRVGQELIITVPEPELSVERTEEEYLEEIYDAPVEYIYNDSWYTNQTKTLQEPSAGFRKIIARVSYLNDRETEREIVKEEVVMEAIPKIVEKGTKVPPTYIKPISGGRKTSGFGRRKQPKPGASTNHKGVDWAVPQGTTVVASCGGTVAKAGWGSGYGYVIYINHPDGRQTRYGHLSKILVKQGQTVSQGQKIALSGNTGVSTGPHLHFEILINGSQVNPEKYLK